MKIHSYTTGLVLISFFQFADPFFNFQQRIVGGSNAKIGEFPWYASIRSRQNHYICGSAIIGQYWVITAAQCVYNTFASNIVVVAGTVFLNTSGAVYDVAGIHLHPYFKLSGKTNDTALLRVTRGIQFNKYVQPIPIAKDIIPEEKALQLCGYGSTGYPFTTLSAVLQCIEVKSISNLQCSTNLNRAIPRTNLCTKGKTAKGACVGDVGSPLIRKGGFFFGRTELHGIVSWGSPCAQGYPDVYSGIAAFRPWIAAMTGISN